MLETGALILPAFYTREARRRENQLEDIRTKMQLATRLGQPRMELSCTKHMVMSLWRSESSSDGSRTGYVIA
jgi:hypothetical protein